MTPAAQRPALSERVSLCLLEMRGPKTNLISGLMEFESKKRVQSMNCVNVLLVIMRSNCVGDLLTDDTEEIYQQPSGCTRCGFLCHISFSEEVHPKPGKKNKRSSEIVTTLEIRQVTFWSAVVDGALFSREETPSDAAVLFLPRLPSYVRHILSSNFKQCLLDAIASEGKPPLQVSAELYC